MRPWGLGVALAMVASCTLDFERFEGVASSTVAASSAAAGGASSAASTASASSTGSGGTVSCDDQYGDAPSYMFCNESATECEFNASVDAQSCRELCEARGGECLLVYNDQSQDMCGHGQQLSCSTDNLNSVICICSRGCGTGAPCASGETCMSGSCQ